MSPLAQGLSLVLVFVAILWASGASADVECQSYADPMYTTTFPGFICPEGFFPI